MSLFKDRITISFSTYKLYMQCPQAFLWFMQNEPFTDARRLNSIIASKDSTLFNQITLNREKEMSIISFDDKSQGAPVVVSASSFHTFKQCPKAFKYHITRTPQTDRKALTNFQFGSLVHNNFDTFIHGFIDKHGKLVGSPLREEFIKWYQSDELKKLVLDKLNSTDEWNRSKNQAFKDFYISIKNHYKFTKSIVDQGCEPIYNYWFGTPKRPLVIQDFGLDRLQFCGEIDQYYINQRGNYVIEDTKTSNSIKFLDADQLYLYGFAMEQLAKNEGTNRKVELLNFNLVVKGYRSPVPFGQEQRETLIANLQALETSIETDSFPAKKQMGCSNCAWRTRCERENFSTKAQKGRLEFLAELKRNVSNQTLF